MLPSCNLVPSQVLELRISVPAVQKSGEGLKEETFIEDI